VSSSRGLHHVTQRQAIGGTGQFAGGAVNVGIHPTLWVSEVLYGPRSGPGLSPYSGPEIAVKATVVALMMCIGAGSAHAAPSLNGVRIECTFDAKSDLRSKVFAFSGGDDSKDGEHTIIITTSSIGGGVETDTSRASSRPELPFQVDREHPPAYRPLIFIGEGRREYLEPSLDGQQYAYVHTELFPMLHLSPANVQSETWERFETHGKCLLKADTIE